jgi:hypothetical protein
MPGNIAATRNLAFSVEMATILAPRSHGPVRLVKGAASHCATVMLWNGTTQCTADDCLRDHPDLTRAVVLAVLSSRMTVSYERISKATASEAMPSSRPR